MGDAAILARDTRRNLSPAYDYILSPAQNRGPQVAAYAGYRIMQHPCGYEVTYGGWHLYTGRTYHDALDYICECEVLRHGQ